MKTLLAIILAISSADALACDCVTPKHPTKSDYLGALVSAHAIFVGVATKLEHGHADDYIDFTVTESLKGPALGPVKISTQSTDSVGSCGYSFTVGKTYLVYAWPDGKGGLDVTHCSFTKEHKQRSREMRFLRKGANNSFKPTPHRGVGHVPALR